MLNGNQIESQTDIGFPTPFSKKLVFKRFYNSQSDINTPMGYGWNHSFSAVLDPNYLPAENAIKITDENGKGWYFHEFGTGHYIPRYMEESTVEVENGNFAWHREDRTKYVFDSAGKLIWIEDEHGNKQTLTYNGSGQLETVMDDASGRVLTFHYNGSGKIDHITGPVTTAVPGGTWVTYGYANDNLTSVTYADGSGFDFEYTDPNDPHNMTAKKDKAGHVLSSWTYDTQDRAVTNQTTDDKGGSIEYVSNTQVRFTDAYGVVRTYTIDKISGRKRLTEATGSPGCATCGEDVIRVEYDNELHVIEKEYVNGRIDRFDNFDDRKNPQTIITAVGTPDERTDYLTYHPDFDLPLTRTTQSLLGSGNKETIFDYDNDGNGTPNENPTALLHAVIQRGYTKDSGVTAYEYITRLTYNTKGRILSIDGPKPGTQDVTKDGLVRSETS
jgi:YD repeat-containing protein